MSRATDQHRARSTGTALRRRLVLSAGLASGALALTGCGIHLQDDAPDVPLVPRRSPIGAETELLALLSNTRELAGACATWRTGPQVALAPRLTSVHRQQADVLAALLGDAHVPDTLVAAATPAAAPGATTGTTTAMTTGSGQGTGGPTAAPAATAGPATPTTAPVRPATSADIAALEKAPLLDAQRLGAAPGPLLGTVAAVLAQRYAAAAVVGGAAPVIGLTALTGGQTPMATTPSGAPAGSATGEATPITRPRPASSGWSDTDLVAVLAVTRSATYGFQVVAAQGDAGIRSLALRTLATLATLQSAQEAALTGPAPPPAIGYPLPFPVTTSALARRLALRLASGLRGGYGSQLGAAKGGSAFLDLVSWLGQVEVLVHEWGGPLAAFPGMTTP